MFAAKKAGPRAVRVATGNERRHLSDTRTAVDVVRGHRLETAGANSAATDDGISHRL